MSMGKTAAHGRKGARMRIRSTGKRYHNTLIKDDGLDLLYYCPNDNTCPTCTEIAQAVKDVEDKLAEARKTFNENYLKLSDNISEMTVMAVKEERERILPTLRLITGGYHSMMADYHNDSEVTNEVLDKAYAILKADPE